MAASNLPALLPSGNRLVYVEQDNQILFSAREIGTQLGYADPYKAITNLFNRNRAELQDYSTILKLRIHDGRFYEIRHFTEEGVYIISMLANTPKARDFRARLAKLLKEIRQHRMELAREAGYLQGRDEALSLPAMQAERKKGYLEGFIEGQRCSKSRDGLFILKKIVGYRKIGLSFGEIGKILGISANAASCRLQRARRAGLLGGDASGERPRSQMALPGVGL